MSFTHRISVAVYLLLLTNISLRYSTYNVFTKYYLHSTALYYLLNSVVIALRCQILFSKTLQFSDK